MVLEMDIESTPARLLKQCRYLQQFFEATDFYTLAPHDGLAHGATRWVLADPGRSAILYAIRPEGALGVRDLPAGRYDLTWLDCLRGRRVEQRGERHAGGNAVWKVPEDFGEELALWVRRAGEAR
jgi:hypothetical protein